MDFRYSWRNLWRNKRRTIITLLALAINTAVLIATFALVKGLMDGYIRYATDLNTGEVQIHAPEYLEDYSLYKRINNTDEILDQARSNGINAAPRLYGYGLLSSGNKSAGVLFHGVVPKAESETFMLSEHVMEGSFLTMEYAMPDQDSNSNQAANMPDAVLGRRLAKTLNVTIGSELIAVVQAADGSMGTELFEVTGIMKSAGDRIDRSMIMIQQEDFRNLFVMPESTHEIVLNSFGDYSLSEIEGIMDDVTPDLEMKTWREITPLLAEWLDTSSVSEYITAIIFLIVAGLGIMNTMLMATFDRIRELGILRALGASPFRVFNNIITESLILSFLATILGAVLGIAWAYHLEYYGIDMSKIGGQWSFGGIVFDPVWRADLTFVAVYKPVIMMWIVAIIASIYPAVLASKLKPVDAMRHN